jgi:N-terminal domain of toast_rack, DUF2154/Domain of unknown function (DUF5668)
MADPANPGYPANPPPVSPGPGGPRYRRGSIAGPIILISLGVLFLIGTMRPDFDVWGVMWRYWPLILIFVGLGKIFDYLWMREHPDTIRHNGVSGVGVALLLLLILFVLVLWRGGSRWDRANAWGGPHSTSSTTWRWDSPGWDGGHGWNGAGYNRHDTQAVELQGAKTVNAVLDMPAGQLTLQGGSTRLLDAEFRYGDWEQKPEVKYTVSGDEGQLEVTQDHDHDVHWGNDGAEWALRLGDAAPLNLKLQMGAGQCNMRLDGLSVNELDVHMGAGELNLDLTGEKNANLHVQIEGGAGQALVRVPRDQGVRVYASGGIGEVNAHDLHRDGDAYVNDAYGKTPTTMEVTIHGGVGQINLEE